MDIYADREQMAGEKGYRIERGELAELSDCALEKLDLQTLKAMDSAQLETLGANIRHFLLQTVMHTGGHLASNLGVVELTLALHRVFDSPKDKIIWDVGHQSYVHKILTGRAAQFSTLRQLGGLSGFPRHQESAHDPFDAGHSSTALSAAMGMACAREISGESHDVVAVIGDGALTGGMVYEALNHIGSAKLPLIIVLNDNEMSISRNVGSVNFHLSRMRSGKRYIYLKRRIARLNPKLVHALERIKNSIKYSVLPSAFFEELGIKYLGPIDGHDIRAMETVLKQAKNFDVPVIVHTLTIKGKGYAPAEQNPEKFHGVLPAPTAQPPVHENAISNSEVFGNTLCELAEKNGKICAITAAMPNGTGLDSFARRFGDRFFDVGIAEQHATTLAAGMAAGGLQPVFAVYSSFLQRAYDQVFHDVCLQNWPVVLAVDRAGPVGEDGATHHGVYDIGYLTQMPNLTVFSPATQEELAAMLPMAFDLHAPAAIRYPRYPLPSKANQTPIQLGKWELQGQIHPIMFIATGETVPIAAQACVILHHHGYKAGLINARFLSPLDKELLARLRDCSLIATAEDGVLNGGLGEHCARVLADCYKGEWCFFGVPETPLLHGKKDQLFEIAGLTPQAMSEAIMHKFEHNALKDDAEQAKG